MTPAGTVALNMLQALDITTRELAQLALLVWSRPSPRLSAIDVQQIMAHFPPGPEPYTDEDLRGAEPAGHVHNSEWDGYPLGGGIDRRKGGGES